MAVDLVLASRGKPSLLKALTDGDSFFFIHVARRCAQQRPVVRVSSSLQRNTS